MKKRYLSLASMMTLCFLLLLISGCGSSDNKEGDGPIAAVGETACIQCHSAAFDKVTNENIVAQFNGSVHSQKGQGCESCHGNGAQHQGKGPIPYPAPDAARCAACHDGTTVIGGVTLAKTTATKWASSNHAKPYEETTGEICYRCHTHEGALLSNEAGYTGDKDGVLLVPAYLLHRDRDFSKFKMEINCETCHEHGGGLRQVKARDEAGNIVNWDPNVNRGVDQYDLCTSCHNLFTHDGKTLIASGKDFIAGGQTVTSKKFYHETAWFRQIASTHYDLPQTGLGSGTGGTASSKIEGYVIRKNGANPCFDCHGHEFKANTRPGVTPARPATIYTDWGKSAHAGKLLQIKYAADPNPSVRNQDKVNTVMAAGVVDDTGAGWSHYDWDDSTRVSDRRACQQCHTSTGVANFLTDPKNYNADNNNFSHLSGWTWSTTNHAGKKSPQNELLYCWGCHSNAGTGDLRNPGALTFTYTNKATVTYPDISGSNVCMACHTGRETGESIKNDPDADGIRSFLNSHYLAAGGQLFGTTGYEYAGLSYANPSFFAHDKVGSAAAPGTGSNGPCAGCHMTTGNSHLFTNVTKDGAGAITAITSTACATCHTGNFVLTAAKMTEEEEEYKDAIAASRAVLAGKGLYFIEAHPYWYKDPAGGSANAFTNWAGVYGLAKWRDVMGAAFNINLLIHDPGGYAHNRYYVKRLLWDSIDFMTNGTLGDINMTATIDGLASLTAAQKAGAKKYLGTARP